MSAAVPCTPSCCSTPDVVNVPGVAGAVGPEGPAGETGPAGADASIEALEVFGSGSVYSLTTTPALLNLGTQQPTRQLGLAGTYLILARALLNLTGATIASGRTMTLLVRNTTTAADLPNSSSTQKLPEVTLLTQSLPQYVKAFTYESSADNEVIQLWGSRNNTLGAGSIDCVEADLIALKIA